VRRADLDVTRRSLEIADIPAQEEYAIPALGQPAGECTANSSCRAQHDDVHA
jgi:hypothetical protein